MTKRKRAVTSEVELDAPRDEVWPVVIDPRRLGDWVTAHVSLGEETPTELRPGTGFEQTLALAGVSFRVSWSVVDCRRPERMKWEGTGPGGATARVSYTLEALADERTRFLYENYFELPGGAFGRMASRAIGGRLARREAQRSLANLKQLMERG